MIYVICYLFNDICYLFNAWFDWKIGIFQQTAVRVYYILNHYKPRFVVIGMARDKRKLVSVKFFFQ